MIEKDIEFYETQRTQFESKYLGKWVLIHQQQVINLFDDFEKAAEQAVSLFGRGPYLIRQIGRLPLVLPTSVAFITRRDG